MARIPLRAYNREIENLIERGQIEEAIAHCKNILRQFPKNIETYRLLGKSYLESQRYTEAADILQRVLSVLPDDFVCQLGMSIIREDEGNLDAAIWHMERAYEVQPFNRAVQDELRRLYGRRDGVEPPRVRLTRGALVRMYARGDLYPQAIAEIRAALAEDHNRIDLLVLLARMYYQSGQKVEATEICSSLIGKLPYCLEANKILMEVLPETSRAEDARVFQQRTFSLDPYAAFISPNAPTSAQVPDQTVMVERVDWQPSMEETQGPDWARTIGVQWEESKEEALPDWLNNISAAPSEIPAPPQAPTTPQAEPLIVTPAGEDILPGFLKEAGWEKSQGEADESAVSALEGMAEGEGEIAEAEIPDWLQSLAPEQTAPAQAAPEAPESSGEAVPDKADLDWLEGILPAAAAAETIGEVEPAAAAAEEEPAVVQPTDETPDWLRELSSPEPEQPSLTEPAAPWGEVGTAPAVEAQETLEPEEKIPDWLSQLHDEPEETFGTPAEPVTSDELPSWLDQTAPASEETPFQPAQEESQWQPGTEETAQPVESLPVEEPQNTLPGELPEWLTEISPGQEPEETVTPSAETTIPADLVGETPYAAQENVPDWLKELSPEGAPPAEIEVPKAVEETPTPSIEAAFEEPSAAPISEVQETGEEIPPVGEPVAGGEAVPAWLSELPQEQEPAVAGQAVEDAIPTEKSETVTEPLQAEAPEVKQPEAAAPDLEDMDSALAWLEALAARQGADTESLKITSEDQRSEVPPDWVQQQMDSTPVSEVAEEPISPSVLEAVEETPVVTQEVEPSPSEPAAPEVPAWLAETAEETPSLEIPEALEAPVTEETQVVEQPASEVPTEEAPVSEQSISEFYAEGAPIFEQPVTELPTEETPVSEQLISEVPSEEVPVSEQPSEVGLPEWLTQVEESPEQPISELPSEGTPVSEQPVESGLPEWITQAEAIPEQPIAETPSMEAPVSEQPQEPGLPEWLTQVEEPPAQPTPQEIARSTEDTQPVRVSRAPEPTPEAAVEPAADVVTPPTEPSPETMPADMAADEAFAWLESLASRQGAQEETLITKPEARVETPPEWVETAISTEETPKQPVPSEAQPAGETSVMEAETPQAEEFVPAPPVEDTIPPVALEEPETSVETAPAPVEAAEEVQIPEWLRSYEEDQQKQPPVWEPTSETITPEAIPEDRIPEWLRKEPEEPVTPAVEEVSPVLPSKQEEEMISWINQIGENEPASAAVEPAETSASMEWTPEEAEQTPPAVESAPMESAPSMAVAEPAAGNAAVLNEARRALTSGDVSSAMDSYNMLVSSDDLVDETIHDLREALSRYPDDVMIWQTLGDAYIRVNRVQEALDAYTKAEELLN